MTTMPKKTGTQPVIAPDVLLLGALYALEQCGLLLNDAIQLVELRRYPTAAGIALLAREELGRHEMLLGFWRDSIAGKSIARDALDKPLRGHENKQRHGSLSLNYMLGPDDQLNHLLRARQTASPGSDEWRAADQQIRVIDARRRRGQPEARHSMRMRAFYVDQGDGDAWLRPSDLQHQKCADEVRFAQNDYQSAKSRIEEAANLYDDFRLADAVKALAARPKLPELASISVAAALPSSETSR